MRYITGDLSEMDPLAEPVALTLGNFDGVHRGHQFLIGNLVEQAQKRQFQSAVLCFHPHPAKVLRQVNYHPLMTEQAKKQAMMDLKVDHFVVQNFDQNFSQVSAEDFLRQYLDRFFNIKLLLVGYDFRFGQNGRGDYSMIKSFFQDKGVEILEERPYQIDQKAPSSSKIREALWSGDIALANEYLGKKYKVSGVVVHGEAKGRTIGFPTANLESIDCLVPGRGVYVVNAAVGAQTYRAICNIGVRPTVDGQTETFEVNLFDFDGDLYGQTLQVEFLAKVRAERKFEDFIQLKEQIERDVQVAKNFKD